MQDEQLWLDGMDPSEEKYQVFVNKFKPKRTTDDCYTPEPVYNAVEKYVREHYGLQDATFVRPFYPGGDYEGFNYPPGAVVVDNPPFSIFKQILAFYTAHNISFFLFAPGLILGTAYKENCTIIAVGESITYENGASVPTSFVTNLEPGVAIRSDPDLHDRIKQANKKYTQDNKKHYDKFHYDDHIITAARVQYLSKHHIDFTLMKKNTVLISGLDNQRTHKKQIYGQGLIVSDRVAKKYAAAEKAAAEKAAAEKAAAEKAAAEKAAAISWPLSERELEIIRGLE